MPRVKRYPRGWVVRNGLLAKADTRRNRHSTAIHEAAHAVVAHVCGETVRRVWLVSDSEGYAESAYRQRYGKVDPIVRGVVALAGHEAECRMTGRPKTLLPAGDLKSVRRMGCSPDSVNALGFLARRLVRWYEPQIRRVAVALVASGSLNRRQFLRAYRVP